MEIKHKQTYPGGVRAASDDNDRLAYLNKWLEMFRPFGVATQDDTWGELEKILDIVHRNHLQMTMHIELKDLAVRKEKVAAQEEKIEQIENTMAAYGYTFGDK